MCNYKKLLSVFLSLLCIVMAGTITGAIKVVAQEKPNYVPVTGVEIENIAYPAVIPGPSQAKLAAILSPTNATNKNVTWASSYENIATVDKNGVVTSKERGSITITVTTEDGGYTDSITLSMHPESNIQISNPPNGLIVGQKTKLKAKITPYTYPVNWTSSDNKIAEIDFETGDLIAKAPGTVKIQAKIKGYYRSPTDTCIITVHSSAAYVAMCVGKTTAIQNGAMTKIDNNNPKVYPFKISGRTMLPIRFIGEKMGGKVTYTNDKAPIYVKYGDVTVKLKIGDKTMTVTEGKNARNVMLDVAATKRDGRVYLPLRALGEALGFDVKYQVISGGEYIVVSNLKMSSALLKERMEEARRVIG